MVNEMSIPIVVFFLEGADSKYIRTTIFCQEFFYTNNITQKKNEISNYQARFSHYSHNPKTKKNHN